VKLVAGKLIYTACGSDPLSAARGFGDSPATRNWTRAIHARTVGVGCAADRDSIRRSNGGRRSYAAVVAARGSMYSEWFAWLASVCRFELLRSKSRWLHRRRPTSIRTSPKSSTGTATASRDDNPLLGKIVGERLYERTYLNAYRSADRLSRNLLQGPTQEQTTPFCDQLTTPRTTTGFMAAGLFNGGQMIAPPPLFSKKLQVTGKRS
jgi:hypothetical protein